MNRQYAELDPDGVLHFAPDTIRAVVHTANQELGSHSFSHLYFREPGVTSADFLADMAAVERLWRTRFGVVPMSLVYPCNQSAFEDVLDETSIRIWRGSEPAWFHDCTTQRGNTALSRSLRLVDSITPWVRRASRPELGMVRASLFVRFGLPEPLWRLQLKRLRNELNHITPGEVFHCWWHEHNVGADLNRGIDRLTDVFDVIAEACVAGTLVSRSMKDLLPEHA